MARANSSNAKSRHCVTVSMSSRGELPGLNARCPSYCGSVIGQVSNREHGDTDFVVFATRARTRLANMFGWSAGDKHRHVAVSARDEWRVRFAYRVGDRIAKGIQARFEKSHSGIRH